MELQPLRYSGTSGRSPRRMRQPSMGGLCPRWDYANTSAY